MSKNADVSQFDQMLYEAEQAGLKLAIKGRIIAVVLITVLLAVSRGVDRAPEFLFAGSLFVLLGLIHFRIIGTSYDRPWTKYVFITIDVAMLSAAVALLPAEPGIDLPDVMIFRFQILPYYFLVLAVAAFSFSPGLLMWTGISGAVGWLAAFFYIRSGMAQTLDWGDIPDRPTAEEFLGIFLNPDFVGTGTRLQEAAMFFVVATLIAIVMLRARGVVRRQLEAERDIASISQLFGRFVPKAIADSMIKREGVLEPVSREATVLIADVAEFTSLTETKGAQAIVDIFNDYFDAASEAISSHNGVVTQFIGDAVFATFNVPVEDEAHRLNGINAALDLLNLVQTKTFSGEKLKIRVGVSTGPVVAGNVGGGGRATYTVYGEAVNLASRLEALNKEQGTAILISENTARGLDIDALNEVGQVAVRGFSAPIKIYTVS
ncbi:MAG: adenylate/guanylate cyclase domain-containing protein [Pseudomonadota bacterium]